MSKLSLSEVIARVFQGRILLPVIFIGWLVSGPALAADQAESSQRLAGIRLIHGENERSHPSVKATFRVVVQEASKSTVRVFSRGIQVALGAVVRTDGYVITKASELDSQIQCQLPDGRRLTASIVGIHPDYDLALLKLPAKKLTAIEWTDSPEPPVGSWLATTGLSGLPTAIGISSAAVRPLPKPRAILGVRLEKIGSQTRVNRVFPSSAAANAGLRVGDVIARVNGQVMERPQQVSAAIRNLAPGDQVTLVIVRDSDSLSVPAILGDASRLGNEEQAALMESLGGPLSERRTGFPYVLQHDTVLLPRDCGGPLVDLDGKVVGINIARVSRVASYAVPMTQLKPVLSDLLAGKYPPPSESVTLETVSAGE